MKIILISVVDYQLFGECTYVGAYVVKHSAVQVKLSRQIPYVPLGPAYAYLMNHNSFPLIA